MAWDTELKATEDANNASQHSNGRRRRREVLSSLVAEALTSSDKTALETCLSDASTARPTVAKLSISQCTELVAHIEAAVFRRHLRLPNFVPWAKEIARRYGGRVLGLRELRERAADRAKGLEELNRLRGRLEFLE